MKPNHKKKLKKLGHLLVKGGKETAKAVGKYGPRVHRGLYAMSDSIGQGIIRKPKRKGYVDLGANGAVRKLEQKQKMKARTRGGYVDMTLGRRPVKRRVTKVNGVAFVDLT